MNKNTTILLGAIAVLAIGAGAYVSMSKPTNEWFATQWVKKTTSPRQTTTTNPTNTVPVWKNEDGGNGWVAGKPIIKHNSNGKCSVTFDDWVTLNWDSSTTFAGNTCCDVTVPGWIFGETNRCYTWREIWVTDVTYGGTQRVEEKVIAEDNYR
jgi:hypothetical protein